MGGVPVTITIDTGASRTLVRRDLVPEESIRRDKTIGIICAHGDEKTYPTAEVEVRVEGERFTVVAGVVETLPAAVLLGKDVGDLDDLVRKKNFACVVVTRQRARAVAIATTEQERKEAECGATPTALDPEEATEADASAVAEEIESQGAGDGDEGNESDAADGEPGGDPFRIYPRPTGESSQPGSGGEERQTRSQRREKRSQWRDQVGLGVDREGFRKLQEDDQSLAKIRREAMDDVRKAVGGHFYRQEGLLYRRWVKRGSEEEDPLVLPLKLRQAVMRLGHSVQMAGHLGRRKTTRRIAARFYWPGQGKDVAEFCKCCPECQRSVSRRKKNKAELIPLPVVGEPFRRVAMDILGPLPRTKSGNKYILVMCDYATW